MKLTFKPSPNYRNKQSTLLIMRDLTMCLVAVLLYSIIFYSAKYGASYGLRVVIHTVIAVGCALACDAVFFKIMKKDIKTGILSSFSWVTALILVLISRIDTAYYAMAVATIIAVFFGKLVFGGFGQNIFNPAALGAAIIMTNFSASYVADFTTGATPTTSASSVGWMIPRADFAEFIAQYGGLGNMFFGQYASTMGSTCALLILVCGAFLIWRRDIDWQLPVFYIGTIFVEALLIGLMHGAGIEYALFFLLAGGILFGGVFMVTDPVTTPVTIPGRVLWAIGAASLTVIIRAKANLSDGVLFAILLMNMLTPAIDKLFDGNQIKDAVKFRNYVLIGGAASVAVTLLTGIAVVPKEPAAAAPAASASAAPAAPAEPSFGEALPMNYNFNANKTECVLDGQEGDIVRYACSAKGFGLVTNAEGTYSRNEAMVTVDKSTGKATSVNIITFGDTAGIGDQATSEKALAQFEGKGLDDEVNLVTGATFTTRSIASMVQKAIQMAANGEEGTRTAPEANFGDALPMSYNFNANKPECVLDGREGDVIRYACSAKGFGLVTNAEGTYSKNEAMVVVDKSTGKVTSVNIINFGDTAGIGDMATGEKALAQFEGKGVDDEVNLVTGATFTTRSIASMVQTALKAAAMEE
ncbi:MAG: RnfABCDGE type electron transport complex subunit D [Solobacterium sp.]|nr:RnfABCDGE type electron transport complex subunit D [Solobacterium sp.]